MTPLRDPVKNIVYNAGPGSTSTAAWWSTAAGCWRRTFDWAGRTADQLLPPTYPDWT